MKIYNQHNRIIFEDNSQTIRQTVENALKQKNNLSGANLLGANLIRADLSRATLSGANLSGATLFEANLSEAKLPHFQIPQEGTLRVWKKLQKSYLCQLEIPASAKRTASLVGRKCRANKAKVLAIFSSKGEKTKKAIGGWHQENFYYEVGKYVECENEFNDDIRIECASGIHFFLTKKEAEEW